VAASLYGFRSPLFWPPCSGVRELAAAGAGSLGGVRRPARAARFLLSALRDFNFLFVTGTIMAERLALSASAESGARRGMRVFAGAGSPPPGRSLLLASLTLVFLFRTMCGTPFGSTTGRSFRTSS